MPDSATTGRTSGSAPESRCNRGCTSPSRQRPAPRCGRSTRRRIAAGGIDNGPPGLRPHYHENYYGAFILDPDGHNIEAVNHLPE